MAHEMHLDGRDAIHANAQQHAQSIGPTSAARGASVAAHTWGVGAGCLQPCAGAKTASISPATADAHARCLGDSRFARYCLVIGCLLHILERSCRVSAAASVVSLSQTVMRDNTHREVFFTGDRACLSPGKSSVCICTHHLERATNSTHGYQHRLTPRTHAWFCKPCNGVCVCVLSATCTHPLTRNLGTSLLASHLVCPKGHHTRHDLHNHQLMICCYHSSLLQLF